jgi:hypothetical protein
VRRGPRVDDPDAVAADRDLPGDAGTVLVDLELGLEAAVVVLDLEVRRRGAAAGPGDAFGIAAAVLCDGRGWRERRDGEG